METLSDLTNGKDKYSTASLKYPLDLGQEKLSHYVNFYIYTPIKSKWAASAKAAGSIETANITDIATGKKSPFGLTDTVRSITDTTTNAYVKDLVKEMSKNIPIGNEYFQNIGEFLMTSGQTQLSDMISLYMPDTIATSQQAQYSNESLTNALGTLGLAASAGSSALDNLEKAGENGYLKQLKHIVVGGDPTLLEGAGKIGRNVGFGKELTGILLNGAGYALNPQMQVIFNDMGFRTYQFDFLMTPRSPEEAFAVKQIIKTFKLHQAPELDTATLGRYYIVPSTFDIEYMAEGSRNDNLHKIASCVLKSVYVDYATRGWATYEDGMPVQIRLTLSFQEKELMTKQRIDQGY